jgi:NADH:ubiquinone oxidoreductase subunit F (NADH-binding)
MTDGTGLPRLLSDSGSAGPASLDQHVAMHGRASIPGRREVAELIRTVDRSGLRGRGGSGFPAAIKIRAVAGAPRRRRRVVVANGAEGEPASRKDNVLLARSPHLVLDGIALATAAVDADEALVCVKAGPDGPARALERAIAERSDIDRVTPSVIEVPNDYLVGEESALVNLLNTGRALPTFVPPRPFERGVGGRPTLVQNVETLAHLALIARHGAEWFRGVGSGEDPGSILITISGAVGAPGVYEIPGGMPLGALVEHVGGYSAPVQAVLVGGYAGSWVSPDRAAELRLGHAAMQARGGTLGPGVVAVLSGASCGVAETARISRYLADHSARQCGPCTFGLPSIAAALEQIAAGSCGAGTHRWVEHWSAQVAGRGACHHPDGAVRMVASALQVFAEDITRHETGDTCIAHVPEQGPLAHSVGSGSNRP